MRGNLPAPLANAYRRIYYGLNYRAQSFGGGRFGRYCRPTHVAFLLTEHCSAKCVHCEIWRARGREDGPTAAEWRDALTDIRDWLGPVHVVLTGGEALLKPFAIELLEHASRIGLQTEFLSHGYWKDPSLFERVAAARPWRVTISLDAVGEVHSLIRGRPGFFERTEQSIARLVEARRAQGLDFSIRLKTVVMQQNIGSLAGVAEYATQPGMDVLYQPVEQNYGASEDPVWYEHSDNWPKDPAAAARALEELARLKESGRHIANSAQELLAMRSYFQDPAAHRLQVQSHAKALRCSALSDLVVRADGAVKTCFVRPEIGNIRTERLRTLWERRPRTWEGGCCLETRLQPSERGTLASA